MIVIDPEGIILVKVDGVIYRIKGQTFRHIKNLIYDLDVPIIKPICKKCRNDYHSCSNYDRTIEDSHITAGLTKLGLKGDGVMVFECKNFAPEIVFDGPISIRQIGDPTASDERDIAHYCDPDSGLHAHVSHPGIAGMLRRMN